MKRLTILLILLIFMVPGPCFAKDKPGDSYSLCKIKADHSGWLKRVRDENVNTYYDRNKDKSDFWIEIQAPEDKKLTGLYLIWDRTLPGARCLVKHQAEEEWTELGTVGTVFHQEYLSLDSVSAVRLEAENGHLSVCELYVLCDGDLPDWVHTWQPTPEKADLLLLCAHPDDEYLFMGGLIPEYAGEKKVNFVMAYLCRVSNERTNELLNGLWVAGCRSYPVLLNYPHKTAMHMNTQYKFMGGPDQALNGVEEMLKRYRPEVVVTHDLLGEYGQGAHKVAADILLRIIRDKARTLEYPVKKLYVHLWEEGPIHMDWNRPLSQFDGKTGLEIAKEAYHCHKSQQNGRVANRRGGTFYFEVKNGGSLDNAAFGLAFSSVGPDTAGNDFLENIPAELLHITTK